MRSLLLLALVAMAAAADPAAPDFARLEDLGLRFEAQPDGFDRGVPVAHVVPGGTAAALGVAVGDRVTAIGGRSLDDAQAALDLVRSLRSGDALTIDVLRGGEATTLAGTARRIASVPEQLAELRREIERLRRERAELERAKREPTLAEIAETLRELPERLREAAATFRRDYPKGEFEIRVELSIVSDRDAQAPVDLLPPEDAAVDAEAETDAPPR